MLGGAAMVLAMLFPAFSITAFLIILALLVSVLVFKNYYKLIERTSLIMVAAFTVLTLASLIAVFYTPFRISMDEFMSGLLFKLPSHLVIFAIGAFGITGVASDEIIAYNYWCIEKGYAAYTGPVDDTSSRRERAKGWIRVMILDASVAMIIYTIVTAAFYLLGAAILHNSAKIPEGNALIATLANIYTESLGNWVRIAYLVGAFFVLFSSVFATLAYWTRLFSDIFGQLGWIDFSNVSSRKRTIAVLSWIFPVLWTVAYLFIELPVLMILSGGVVGSVLLLLVVFAALCFRYRMNDHSMKPGFLYDLLLWSSIYLLLQ